MYTGTGLFDWNDKEIFYLGDRDEILRLRNSLHHEVCSIYDGT